MLTRNGICLLERATPFKQIRRFIQEGDTVKHKVQVDDVFLDNVGGPEEYGLRLAARFGMPDNVVETAREMRVQLRECDAARSEAGLEKLPAALEIFKVLNAIRKKTKGDTEEARDLFVRLQEKLCVG